MERLRVQGIKYFSLLALGLYFVGIFGDEYLLFDKRSGEFLLVAQGDFNCDNVIKVLNSLRKGVL